MKKLLTVIYALVCMAGFSQTITLETAVQNGALYLQSRILKGTRIAVIPAQNSNPELSSYAADLLRSVLINKSNFTVVERNEAAFKAVGAEMTYQLSGDVSDETSLYLGRQLGAEQLISCLLTRQNREYRMEIKAVHVETARVTGQWTSGNIRSDQAWSTLDKQEKPITIIFSGDELTSREKDTLTEGVRAAFDKHKVPLVFDEEGVNTSDSYSLIISIYNQTATAGKNLLQGEATIKFNQGRRTLKQSNSYRVTETNMSMLVRRVVEQMQADNAFFQGIAEIVNR